MYSKKDFPEEYTELNIDRVYSENEFQKISKGTQPNSMDDKWHIEYIEPFLYIRRSWTGFCLYKIEFKKIDSLYKVEKLYSNRNTDEYKETNTYRDSLLALFKLDQLAEREGYKALFDEFIELTVKNKA